MVLTKLSLHPEERNVNGAVLGACDGALDGTNEGTIDGVAEGVTDGTPVDGTAVGTAVGVNDETTEGAAVDGATLGATLGPTVGGSKILGCELGWPVGDAQHTVFIVTLTLMSHPSPSPGISFTTTIPYTEGTDAGYAYELKEHTLAESQLPGTHNATSLQPVVHLEYPAAARTLTIASPDGLLPRAVAFTKRKLSR